MSHLYITRCAQATQVQSLALKETLEKQGWVCLGEKDLTSTINAYQSMVAYKVAGATVLPLDPTTRALITLPPISYSCDHSQ